ncbi:NUDIX hydrolase [Luteimonas sp. RIT-PG2_3]
MTEQIDPNHAQTIALAEAFARYQRDFAEEADVVAMFIDLLDDAEDPFVRERLAGHFTASALVVGGQGTRTLLTHHRKLGLWLQPGGHADGDRDLARVALREAEEETGLQGLQVLPTIFDLDRHWIPEHKGIPGHWHYDVRYVVLAGPDERFVVSEESLSLAWRDLAALADDAAADGSLRRMARKWRAGRAAP